MPLEPGHKEWDDLPCPRCRGRESQCVICEGSGVVPLSLALEYKLDPIKVLARKIVDDAELLDDTYYGYLVSATTIDRLKATYTL